MHVVDYSPFPESTGFDRSQPNLMLRIQSEYSGAPDSIGVLRSSGVLRIRSEYSGAPESNPEFYRIRSRFSTCGFGVDSWIHSGVPITNANTYWQLYYIRQI
uniref:Uncharacterized protein n=1 Tax=Anopheles maculatus TaxID=74869 RepID=A0A182SWZ2_9DIPT